MKNIITVIIAIIISSSILAQTQHEEKIENYQKEWSKLIPSQLKGQFAGSMGMFSAGIGWDYGKKKQWESNFLLGIVPCNKYEKGHATMTLKQTYTPFSIKLGNDFQFNPLTTGLYINKIFGEYFWVKQPSKYPKNYYFWSVNTRFNIFIGQSFTIPFNNNRFRRSASIFYEVNTNDLYFISYIGNKVIKLHDIIGLSIGVRFRFFDY